jgi:hypothetical protein
VLIQELNETYWSSEKMLPVSAYGVSEKYQKRFKTTGGTGLKKKTLSWKIWFLKLTYSQTSKINVPIQQNPTSVLRKNVFNKLKKKI